MEDADAVLRAAIETLYKRFDRFVRPEDMHAAPTRDVESVMSALTSAPLRELSSEALNQYSMWAITTIGDPEDYMHFLPRIFELATSEGSFAGISPEAIASKLDYAAWRLWGDDLCVAVEEAFRAGWARARLQHPDEEHAEGWLWGFARLGMEIGPELDGWLECCNQDSMAQLAWFVMLSDNPFENLEYDDWASMNVRKQIADWILSEPVGTALSMAADIAADSDLWLFEKADARRSTLRQIVSLH